jgi:hypothetical protein
MRPVTNIVRAISEDFPQGASQEQAQNVIDTFFDYTLEMHALENKVAITEQVLAEVVGVEVV